MLFVLLELSGIQFVFHFVLHLVEEGEKPKELSNVLGGKNKLCVHRMAQYNGPFRLSRWGGGARICKMICFILFQDCFISAKCAGISLMPLNGIAEFYNFNLNQ